MSLTTFSEKLLFVIMTLLCTVSYSSQNRKNTPYRYAVVIRSAAYNDPAWKRVADTLLTIHGNYEAKLFQWNTQVTEVKSDLSTFKPDYIGYVCRPVVDVNSDFVSTTHQLTRELDEDAYNDAVFGIITGFEAQDALRAVTESFVIKTGIISHQKSDFGGFYDPSPYPDHRYLYQQISQSEGGSNYPWSYYNFSDGSAFTEKKPVSDQPDRIVTISNWLNAESIHLSVPQQGDIEGSFDLFSTSGHGNIDTWQAQFPGAVVEGYLKSRNGQLYGSPQSGGEIPINAKTPKVYFATGNCLIGNPDDIDNMVYAWFHTGHAVHMVGYIVTSGYGYNGWGNLGRFLNFAGKHNVAETYFITMESMLYDIENGTPGTNLSQLQHYQNNVVMYGDPKADAYTMDFGDSARVYLEKLLRKKAGNSAVLDTFVYTVTPHHFDLEGDFDFYRSIRPFQFLPVRLDAQSVIIDKNDGKGAAITDNFVLWDLIHTGEEVPKGVTKTLQWRAKVVEEVTAIGNKKTIATIPRPHPWIMVSKGIIAGTAMIEIFYGGFTGKSISAVLYTATGSEIRLVTSDNKPAANTTHRITLSFKRKLSAGIYVLVISDSHSAVHKKVICTN